MSEQSPEKKTEPKVTLADALKFIKSKGFKPEALARFKKQAVNRKLTSEQVQKALMANKRDKLKTLCHHVAATGHAHLYLSVMGDKVVLTGVDQLKGNLRPFNKRGFGSTKHPLTPSQAAKVKKPYLSRLDPEARKAISRKGGLAAAKKRADHAAKIKARGPHWTQKPENRDRVKSLLAKATAANKAKKDAKKAGA